MGFIYSGGGGYNGNNNEFVCCCRSACVEYLMVFALKGLLSVVRGHHVYTYSNGLKQKCQV